MTEEVPKFSYKEVNPNDTPTSTHRHTHFSVVCATSCQWVYCDLQRGGRSPPEAEAVLQIDA